MIYNTQKRSWEHIKPSFWEILFQRIKVQPLRVDDIAYGQKKLVVEDISVEIFFFFLNDILHICIWRKEGNYFYQIEKVFLDNKKKKRKNKTLFIFFSEIETSLHSYRKRFFSFHDIKGAIVKKKSTLKFTLRKVRDFLHWNASKEIFFRLAWIYEYEFFVLFANPLEKKTDVD